jgi:iron complex transport system ATP-binding protein
VQIARALMTDPELMLLDEPAAGLDLAGREDLVRRLGDLAADVEAPALVLVTHHVEEIPPSFTDVLLLREGRVVAQGPIEITLTAENLSETFGLPLLLERHGERWSARAHPGANGHRSGTGDAPATS